MTPSEQARLDSLPPYDTGVARAFLMLLGFDKWTAYQTALLESSWHTLVVWLARMSSYDLATGKRVFLNALAEGEFPWRRTGLDDFQRRILEVICADHFGWDLKSLDEDYR